MKAFVIMKKDPMRIQAHIILGTLILQYLLGMFANMFVNFPNTKNETALWEFAKVQPSVMTHIILGALLVIGGIVLLIRAIRKKDKQWILASSVGLLSLLIASIAGARFIPTQQDGYSFVMAVTFLLAVFSYGWGLYKAKR